MYIDSIAIESFRTFRDSGITFVHPDMDFDAMEMPAPRLPNVNLILGDNGLGKTTLLKAIALAALGPAVGDSGIYPYRLIRQEPARSRGTRHSSADIAAMFTLHDQDREESKATTRRNATSNPQEKDVASLVTVTRRGDLELLRWSDNKEERQRMLVGASSALFASSTVADAARRLKRLQTSDGGDDPWALIFSSASDAFFFVGYGATRRVEKREQVDMGSRRSNRFIRAQRVQSLFEEAHSLLPLNSWLPEFRKTNPGRFKQTVNLINGLLGGDHYRFTGELEAGEYVFERNGLKVPFPALSDGYRAFLGWVSDLLYHICQTCPRGKKLVDNRGIVMVDEIDLHLHPRWQMTILPTIAKQLPNIQFIVTSHSPLVVGSLEWMNIIVMKAGPGQTSRATRIRETVHGLDADQILLTDFFRLTTTRAPGKSRRLKTLTEKARTGDVEAAKQLLEEMSRGEEDVR